MSSIETFLSEHIWNKLSMHKKESINHVHHNHHLFTAVAGLIAIFAALTIYLVYQKNHPVKRQSSATSQPLPASNTPSPNTPTGRTSFTGTIREINDNRLTVRTVTTVGGRDFESLILATVTDTTDIGKLGELKLGQTFDAPSIRERTAASTKDLRPGTGIEVFSAGSIDGKTSLTATQIDIITPAAT